MARRAQIVIVACLVLLAAPATAQVPGPESVAAQLLAADSSGDWRTVLRIAAPEAVADFQREQVAMLTLVLATDPRVAAFMQRALDSTQARMMVRFREAQRTHMLDSVFHVPSIDSLAALPADSVLARWYRGRSRDWQSADPHYRIIGTVQPADSVAYVVLDLSGPSPPLPPAGVWGPRSSFRVLVVRRVKGEWRTLLDVVPNPLAGLGGREIVDSL